MREGLSGKQILVVEDDYFEATELAAGLEAEGFKVIGPVADIEKALERLQQLYEQISGAVLDINLGGRTVFPVADELDRQGIPFIFATGYEKDTVPPRHTGKLLLRKPLDHIAVIASLIEATEMEPVTKQDVVQNKLLEKLAPVELDLLVPLLRKTHLPQGAILELQASPVNRIFFPLTCVASLIVVGSDGSRIETGLIGREGMTGFGLVEGDEQTPYELINQIDGAALTMAAADFSTAVTRMPRLQLLARRFVRVLTLQVSYTAFANGRLEIPQRLARWLLMMQDRSWHSVELRITHDYLATMLGVRRPSVTTALHILEGERMIRSSRGQITIIDRPKLIIFAGEGYGQPEEEYKRLMALPLDLAIDQRARLFHDVSATELAEEENG